MPSEGEDSDGIERPVRCLRRLIDKANLNQSNPLEAKEQREGLEIVQGY